MPVYGRGSLHGEQRAELVYGCSVEALAEKSASALVAVPNPAGWTKREKTVDRL